MGDGGGTGADPLTIRTVAETGSTNADLLALAQSGVAEGLWLRADRQNAGRGRQGRAWVSPPGNLYASTLVRLRPGDPAAPTLAFVAAVALEEGVRSSLASEPGRGGEKGLSLKWPNDLLIDGAKLAGILLERSGDAVVIGFGVNLAHHPTDTDRRATSLAERGIAVAPDRFVGTLADGFARWLSIWRSAGLGPVLARWSDRAHPIGTPLAARLPDAATLDGVFDGLSGDGALNLRLADGTRRVIHAGDVFLV